MRSDEDLKKWLRRLALGVSATPLVFSVGCGRREVPLVVEPNASVIVSRDFRDAGSDAGFDAGVFDAGRPDAGELEDAGADAGMMFNVIWGCGGYAVTSSGRSVTYDGGGLADPQLCTTDCPDFGAMIESCQVEEVNDLICWYQFCGIGRLTNGVTPRGCANSALGSELANMAAHEAGAALAFAQLTRELERHGVHRSLTRGARRAAREEVRHAQLVGGLARAHGGRFSVTPARDTQRSLEDIALENAAEGCVRETLGALIGLHQSRHASDPAVRSVMVQVSADELGHSVWSHALAKHLDSQLSLPARRRVREARAAALENAMTELSSEPNRAIGAQLGLPDAERVHTLGLALSEAS
jgi:hypothetical protein